MIEPKHTRVLDMCRRFGRDFTMSEIIERVLDERPEMMFEFSEIWGELVRTKSVVVFTRGEPCTYACSK
jgi:hypothetical protein